MNVSKVYIPLMNNAFHIQRVELPKPRNGLRFGRRIRTIWEIEEYEQYREVAVWSPRTDTFETWFENSILLERIAVITGKTRADLLKELEVRRKFLHEIVKKGVRDQKEVAEMILGFYSDQQEESKPRLSKKKKPGKKKNRSERVEEEKSETTPQTESSEEIDIIPPQDMIARSRETIPSPIVEGEQ
jgi:hypothetical protein